MSTLLIASVILDHVPNEKETRSDLMEREARICREKDAMWWKGIGITMAKAVAVIKERSREGEEFAE